MTSWRLDEGRQRRRRRQLPRASSFKILFIRNITASCPQATENDTSDSSR